MTTPDGRSLDNSYWNTFFADVFAEGRRYETDEEYLAATAPRHESLTKVPGVADTRSTSRTLALQRPTYSWDVKGYYRSLGIAWPYVQATKGELSKAYIAQDGQWSEELSYHLFQLLDPEVRQRYDRTPLGGFFSDREDAKNLKDQLLAEVQKRLAAGEDVTLTDVMNEYDLVESPYDPNEYRPQEWAWTYWLFRTTDYDTDLLELWEPLLVTAFDEQGLKTLRLGMTGEDDLEDGFRVMEDEDGSILLVSQCLTPSAEHARIIAAAVVDY